MGTVLTITIGMDPAIFRIGAFTLSWYSLAVMLAAAVGIYVGVKLGARQGFKQDDIISLATWALLAALVGARLFHVVDRWDYYSQNPVEIIMLNHGGLAIWGGLIGAFVAVIVFAHLKKLPMGRLFDVVAFALLTGQIVGRLGCIVNGDTAGSPTGLPWGIMYTNPSSPISDPSLLNIPTQPYPLYEMAWNLLTIYFLWNYRKRFKVEGQLFLAYLAVYSLGRFLLSYVRLEKTYFLGLQEAQIVAVVTIVGAIVASLFIRNPRPSPTPDAAEKPASAGDAGSDH